MKKIEKIPPSNNNKNIKSSYIKKNKNINGIDNPQIIKLFTEKYEKEKENFNSILFDEYIELRKKFKLEILLKDLLIKVLLKNFTKLKNIR